MNVAAVVALVAASLNLGAASLVWVLARAPGWRAARVFAGIAVTAGIYNCSGFVFATGGLTDGAYLFTARIAYLAAHLNTLIWLVQAFGGPDASWAAVPRWLRTGVLASGVLAVLTALTGFHLAPVVGVVEVPWAGAAYHLPLTTAAGDVYSLLILGQFAVVFGQLIRRLRSGESTERLQVVAFGFFFVASIFEALTALRVIQFPSLGDIGMLVIVLPVSQRVVRRVVADATRLEEQRGRLAGTVREQRLWQDRAQTALAESERLAALGRLAAGVGHEINNPLTYLTLALEQVDDHLKRSVAPAEIQSALADARDGAVRIQRVAERLRSYSRGHDERVPVDLRDVVASAVKVAGPSMGRGLTVTANDLVPAFVAADESRLVQAVVNLLVNAGQAVAARPGAGTVRVSIERRPPHDVVLAIEDDGDGIPPAHLERLGEPYFTTRAARGGLGLGYFVTRGIVDAHGGRLEVESRPGEGTVVRVMLPELAFQRRPAGVTARHGERVVPPIETGRGQPPGPAKPSVLIVDDEPLVTKLLTTILRRDWHVEVAANGTEALARLAQRRFDGILCDLMMPGMSGIDLAGYLEEHDVEHRRRMVFLTGGAVTDEADAFLTRPDVAHLTKPVSRAVLLGALNALRQRPS